MIIEKNRVVTLHYKLQEQDATGDLIEETFGSDPLVFLYGAGQMIPEFERQLAGKKAGEPFSFAIDSKNAYGDINQEAIVPVPKSAFVIDGKLAEDLLEVGRTLPMQDDQGNRLQGMVKEVQDEEVVLDFNHPMAGVNLYFTGKIEEVRPATETEIEHGHVHGPGGHEH